MAPQRAPMIGATPLALAAASLALASGAAVCGAGRGACGGGGGGSEGRRADILERFLAPVARSEFFTNTFERAWGYYPHNESLIPITMGHVAEWFGTSGQAAKAVEVLPHPVTKKPFKGKGAKNKPLERYQDAFLQGYSMVVNSLHLWSDPGAVLARELYESIGLPVDVYMYLTPPHSQSYTLHCDVMDAFMVQLSGSKTWRICEERNYRSAPASEYKGKCQDVTLRGGDVLYLPFNMMHHAVTTDELSSHLTVNIERQYYVWATLIVAAVHKVLLPDSRVENFMESGAFSMESETDLENYFHELMHLKPQLAMLPLSQSDPLHAAQWLARPLSGADLPGGYLDSLLAELTKLVSEVLSSLAGAPKLGSKKLKFGRRTIEAKEAFAMLVEPTEDVMHWVLEVARLHSVKHFGRDNPQRLFPPADVFSSLAAARSEVTAAGELNEVKGAAAAKGRLVGPGAWLVRRQGLRAVLRGAGGGGSGAAAATLQLDNKVVAVKLAEEELVHFCLGLFSPSSAQGRAFAAASVPGGLEAARPTLESLILEGALRLLPGEPSAEEFQA